MDALCATGVFSVTNALFEGSIGLCHLLLPNKVYATALHPVSPQQVLFGRFFGAMMLTVSAITLLEHTRRGVNGAIAGYHIAACALNATLGCGIDGNVNNPARDWFHAAMHGVLGFGFAWMTLRPNFYWEPVSFSPRWKLKRESGKKGVTMRYTHEMSNLNAASIALQRINFLASEHGLTCRVYVVLLNNEVITLEIKDVTLAAHEITFIKSVERELTLI